MSAGAPAPARPVPVDEGDTRSALLRAALARFAASPYGEVTIRGIAADADVSAPLVIKYFGTKERLFLAAADYAGDFEPFLAPDLAGAELARHLVAQVMAIQTQPGAVNPFSAMLFMGSGRDTPPAVRDRLRSRFVSRLAERLDGPDAALRAELVCAQLVGLSALLRALRLPELLEAEPDAVVQLYTPALRTLLGGG
jgi:AcrR family transcriptional regulator